MKLRADLAGRVFGRLTVIAHVADRNTALGRTQWRCECTCGVMVIAVTSELTTGRVTSCGCGHRVRTGPASDWTDDRIERLKALWRDGLSAGEIATRLGRVTRSAVLGKLHRLKLRRDQTPKAKRERGAQFAKIGVKARNDNRPVRPPRPQRPSAAIFALAPLREAPEEVVVPAHERRGLADMPDDNCHWPIGDPLKAEFHFCNRTKVPNLPYCEAHCRRAYLPPEPRRVRARDAPEAAVSRTLEEVS